MEGEAGILLLQSEWPARALLKAELEERGFDVLGADTLSMAIDLSMRRGFRPELLVVNAVGLVLESGDVDGLLFLRGNAPLLLITSGQYADPAAASLAPTRVLPRPCTMGAIAEEVERLARHR